MADNKFVIVTPSEVSCYNSGNQKTVLQAAAPSSFMTKILGWSIAFDGISVTNEPVIVRLIRQTTAGTSSSTNASKLSEIAETVQTVGAYNFTVEPTEGVYLDVFEIHPQGGFDVRYPEGEEVIVPAGGYVGITVVANVAVNCSAKLICEE